MSPRRLPKITRNALTLFSLSAMAACTAGETVKPGDPYTVEFSSSMLTFTSMNDAQSVTATVRDNKGVSIPDASVDWDTENPSIATVSGGGRTVQIIGKSPGYTNVRVSSGSAEATLIVAVLGVKSVQLDPANVSLRIGETKTVRAQVNADAGVSTEVTWTTGNAAVATISETGVLTAVAPGATTIRATSVADTKYHATGQIAVAPIRGIVIAPSQLSLGIGQTQLLSATVSLSPGQSTALTWNSSNPSVATVSAQGQVTAISIGNTVITATSVADPTLTATSQLSVIPTVRSISLSPSSSQVYIGDQRTLTATVVADPGVSQALNWSSSNPSIATVSSAGVVTAVGVGSATITAQSAVDASKRATATFVVSSRPLGVAIVQGNISIAPGASSQLTAIVTANPGTPTGVVWSTSAANIATVSSTGLVTGVASGAAQITATSQADASKKATITVTVTPRLATSWNASRINGALFEDVLSIYPANDNSIFAVNLMGDVFRYNGLSWTRVLVGSENGTIFKAVHGTSATNVFAVGTNGRVFRWQGTTWQSMTSGTSASLNAVYAASPTAVFAVGDDGSSVRFNGTAWTPIATGSSENLQSVWASGNIAYAVGENGEAVRFNGATWARYTTPTTEHLHGVAGIDADNVVAVGDFGTIIRFNGTEFSQVSSGVTADLFTVAVSPTDSKVYVSGSFGTVLQLSSTAIVVETPYTSRFIASMVDASGNLWTAGQRGIVQRRTGSTWSVLNLAPDLLDVWSTSASNAWAVGEFGFIYRWNGSTWSRQESPTRERLNTVWGTSPDNAFAGGDGGLMLHWNGISWSEMSFPAEDDVLAIWGSSASDAFAVTFGGDVLRFNGSTWSVVASSANSLYGVWGSATNNVYAIGDNGTVLRFDGIDWTPGNLGSSALLVGLWSSSPTSALTVGLSPSNPTLGAAYQFNGSTWSPSNLSMSPPELTSIWGTSNADLYATGGAGTIIRYNGSVWQSMSTNTSDYLWSVTGSPNGIGGAFAVGYNSTVVTGSTTGSAIASMMMPQTERRSFDPSPRSPRAIKSAIPDGDARKSHRARKDASRRGR